MAAMRDDWRVPHPSRLASADPHREEILQRHDRACRSCLATYADPVSGLSVFTAEFLARRGWCCESGCRHCPFVGADSAEA